jgi:periplasmic divalent cation tolerance protein
VMKTRAALVARLCERVAQLHPYEVPELVALRASQVAEAYGRWVAHETIEVNG